MRVFASGRSRGFPNRHTGQEWELWSSGENELGSAFLTRAMSGVMFSPSRSQEQSVGRIIAFGLYGQHRVEPRPRSWLEVCGLLALNGCEPMPLVEELRDPSRPVPLFENLIPPGFRTVGSSVTAQVVETSTREPLSEPIKGEGQIVTHVYAQRFHAARKAFNAAIADSDYAQFEDAVVSGIAAIEGFLNEMASVYSTGEGETQVKVSLETKLREWVPLHTDHALDLTGTMWAAFKARKKGRDDRTVHPKESAFVVGWQAFARQANEFRDGIATLLLTLHRLYRQLAPADVINASFAPDVVVKERAT